MREGDGDDRLLALRVLDHRASGSGRMRRQAAGCERDLRQSAEARLRELQRLPPVKVPGDTDDEIARDDQGLMRRA